MKLGRTFDNLYPSCFCLWLLAGGVFGNVMLGLTAAVHLILLLLCYKKRGGLRILNRIDWYLWVCMLFCGLGTLFWGVDRWFAWIGVLRLFATFLFLILVYQFSAEDRNSLIQIIPWLGAIMTVTAYAGSRIQKLSKLFVSGGRLSGSFHYANTYALFIFLGIIILHHRKWEKKSDICCFAILMGGIYLSGSRTIWIFFIAYEIWKALHLKNKKHFFKITVCFFAIVGGITYFTGRYENIGRFWTINLMESTLLGRLLYVQDAIPMLLKYPFGMGYMGYFYMQQAMQTGLYRIRFVHNDLLQMGLDYGIPFLLVGLLYIGRNVLRKGCPQMNRELLAVILGSSLLDFHLQFLAILWIAILLCVDAEQKTIKDEEGNGTIYRIPKVFVRVISPLAVIVMIFNGIGQLCMDVGNYKLAVWISPFNTEALVYEMLSQETIPKAASLAKRIENWNPYQREAHQIMAYYYMDEKNYEKMAEECEQVIFLSKYKNEGYEEYKRLIANAIFQCEITGDGKEKKFLEEKLLYIEDMKTMAILNTSFLAYLIDEKPEI